MWMRVTQDSCADQRTASRSWFYPGRTMGRSQGVKGRRETKRWFGEEDRDRDKEREMGEQCGEKEREKIRTENVSLMKMERGKVKMGPGWGLLNMKNLTSIPSVYMCAHSYVYVSVFICACMCSWVYVCVHSYVYVCVHVCIHISMCMHIFLCEYACKCMLLCGLCMYS